MSSTQIASSFVEDAPPGELSNVINDIKALTPSDTNLVSSLSPAITKYHQTHFSTVKLPNASNSVLVSPYNHLGESRYYDSASNKSFVFDPVAQTASDVQSYEHETRHADVVQKLLKGLRTHAEEHYPAAVVGVFAVDDDGDKVALVLVSNKYSPNNFWNGQWRAHYLFTPSNSSLTGEINIDVHYYEDGNVRLQTSKPITISNTSDAIKEIAKAEKSYQTEVNQAFTRLNEGAFKGLRRQLPVTRQKVEWEKISGYRLGQDIGGGRAGR